jgi:hypothetical protein
LRGISPSNLDENCGPSRVVLQVLSYIVHCIQLEPEELPALVIHTFIMQDNPDIVWLAVCLDLLESIS